MLSAIFPHKCLLKGNHWYENKISNLLNVRLNLLNVKKKQLLNNSLSCEWYIHPFVYLNIKRYFIVIYVLRYV